MVGRSVDGCGIEIFERTETVLVKPLFFHYSSSRLLVITQKIVIDIIVILAFVMTIRCQSHFCFCSCNHCHCDYF